MKKIRLWTELILLSVLFLGCVEDDISGTFARLSLSDGPVYDFGSVDTGTSSDKTFTLSNDTDIDASLIVPNTLSAPFEFKGGTFPGTGGTCTNALSANQNCTVVVTFSPTATQTDSSALQINYFNGASLSYAEVALSGTGHSPSSGGLTISDGPFYDFGTVATSTSSDKTFTVTNTSGSTATGLMGSGLSAPYSFKGGSYPGTGGTCAVTLAAAATCTMVVTFAPTIAGVASDDIVLNYTLGSAQSATRSLQGTGL